MNNQADGVTGYRVRGRLCVVDEHADRALGLLDRGHGRAHRLLVGYVEGERATAPLRQVRDRLELARGRVHPVAA
jgi:hypothetical protein